MKKYRGGKEAVIKSSYRDSRNMYGGKLYTKTSQKDCKSAKYRNEWKYILTDKELCFIKPLISSLMESDYNTPDEKESYITHSLYFDDYKNTSLYETKAKLPKRHKWRIRFYENNKDYIVLVKKEKVGNRNYKKTCRLTINEYENIVSGNIINIFYDIKKELIKELAKDMLIHNYQPKIIIEYERTAYMDETTNIRITFDKKISASFETEHFLDGDYTKYYIQPFENNIMEIKFDDILPSYIRNITKSYLLSKTSFSKYYYCTKFINSYTK